VFLKTSQRAWDLTQPPSKVPIEEFILPKPLKYSKGLSLARQKVVAERKPYGRGDNFGMRRVVSLFTLELWKKRHEIIKMSQYSYIKKKNNIMKGSYRFNQHCHKKMK